MQGRLIPGTSVASLPFLEALRGKASAAALDALPDECFGRLRGALFLGPSWTVTRNKLKVRCVFATQCPFSDGQVCVWMEVSIC